MFAVIMAGGKGARFWPRSREKMPKHLLDIQGERTIIRETVDRIRPLVPPERTLIVTGTKPCRRADPPAPRDPRGKHPHRARRAEHRPLHRPRRAPYPKAGPGRGDAGPPLRPPDRRRERVPPGPGRGRPRRRPRGDALVTIGIRPTGPETGYGYIEQGDLLPNCGDAGTCGVRSIREKPPLEQAREFLRQGGFSLEQRHVRLEGLDDPGGDQNDFCPNSTQGLMQIREALGTEREEEIVGEVYSAQKAVSIDYGVMEKAENVLVVPGDFGWSDLGSWDALWEVSGKDENGNAVRGPFIGIDAGDSLVHSPGKLVALVGVRDLLVVETDDALLICRRGRSQDVRKVVEILESKGLKEYL